MSEIFKEEQGGTEDPFLDLRQLYLKNCFNKAPGSGVKPVTPKQIETAENFDTELRMLKLQMEADRKTKLKNERNRAGY